MKTPMSKELVSLPKWVVGILVMGIFLAACGEDEPTQEDPDIIECGEGTRLDDGFCVPDLRDGTCEDGKVLSAHGACINPELYCGDNSVYDSSTDTCIDPATISCGPGTIEVDGQCVVENPLSCGEGTVLADGECLLSEEVCGEGTEFDAPYCYPTEDACQEGASWDVVNGECIHGGAPTCGEDTVESDGQCLPTVTVADQLAANANMDYTDGTAIAPSAASAVVFTGTMDDALHHTFEVEATQGQWMEITVYTRGLPAPGFDLTGSGDWRRTSVPGMANPATRTVFFPANGTYELTIKSSFSDHPAGAALAEESWKYVGTAELVNTPTALQWNPVDGPLHGNFRQTTSNFIEVLTPGIDEIVLTPEALGSDAEGPTLEIWSSTTSFSERQNLNIGEQFLVDTSGNSTYLHLDAKAFYGPYANFSVSAELPLNLQPGQFTESEVYAEAGQLIRINQTNTSGSPMDALVYFQGQLVDDIGELRATNFSGFCGSTCHLENWHYAQESGTYTVRYENNGSSDLNNVIVQASARTGNIFELPEPQAGPVEYSLELPGTTPAGQWPLVVVKTPSAAHIEWSQSKASGITDNRVLDSARNQLQNSFNDDYSITLPDAGVYYFYVRLGSSGATDISINATGESLETMAPGEVLEWHFDNASTFDALTGTISYDSGSAPTVRMYNPNGQLVFEDADISSGYNVVELFPGPGDFRLEIENTGTTPIIGIDADLHYSSSFDTVSSAQAFDATYDRPDPLAEGEREVLVMQAQSAFAMQFALAAEEDDELGLTIWNANQKNRRAQTSGTESLSISIPDLFAGIYIVEIQALSDLDDGYTLFLDGFDINLVGGTSNPNMEIPNDGGTTSAVDSISISGCDEIIDLEIDVHIEHWWRGDLTVDIVHPNGTSVRIHDQSGGAADDIIGTYPYPEDTGLEDGEGLLDFVGLSGNGSWQIIVTDVWSGGSDTYGDLLSWGVMLTCAE